MLLLFICFAVITVLPGIHCAVGYGLANSILIEGIDGNKKHL
jgi:hypothetical protein